MSIVTNVARSLGIVGSHLPKIGELKVGIRRALPLNVGVGRSKAWASQREAEQFERNQVTSRALNESMARLAVAR